MLNSVSIVIPAYNEGKRLPQTLEVLSGLIENQSFKSAPVTEVIVVDDGSSDDTIAIAQSWSSRLPQLKVVESGKNYGKGHAIRLGISESTAEWVLIADADMATPWTELEKLAIACSENNTDVAIGSRDLKESEIIVHQSWMREHLGKSFNTFVRLTTGLSFRDTQCGFKLFHREKVHAFLKHLIVDRFAWDVEFLLIAQKYQLSVIEIPVVWEHKDASRVHPIIDGSNMLFTVLKIKLRLLLGKYT